MLPLVEITCLTSVSCRRTKWAGKLPTFICFAFTFPSKWLLAPSTILLFLSLHMLFSPI